MNKKICLLPGDGIGPEILAEGRKVLEAVGAKTGCTFTFDSAHIGAPPSMPQAAPFPKRPSPNARPLTPYIFLQWAAPSGTPSRRKTAPNADFSASAKPSASSPICALPCSFPTLAGACLLRPEAARNGLDFIVVRELTGDIYFGEPRGLEVRNGLRTGYNTMIYNEEEIRRIARIGFETAMKRRRKVCSVDKSNVLETSRLWRAVVAEVHRDYPEVELSNLYVDNAAMQLVRDPSQFDVILTGNIFGDILSDEASAITGSLGMLPSASVGAGGPGLFEPVHGSAPDIAGQDKANPLATILSGAMMLRLGLNMPEEAALVEKAVRLTLQQGYRTPDIMEEGKTLVGCKKMGDLVAANIGR